MCALAISETTSSWSQGTTRGHTNPKTGFKRTCVSHVTQIPGHTDQEEGQAPTEPGLRISSEPRVFRVKNNPIRPIRNSCLVKPSEDTGIWQL